MLSTSEVGPILALIAPSPLPKRDILSMTAISKTSSARLPCGNFKWLVRKHRDCLHDFMKLYIMGEKKSMILWSMSTWLSILNITNSLICSANEYSHFPVTCVVFVNVWLYSVQKSWTVYICAMCFLCDHKWNLALPHKNVDSNY